MASYLDRSKEQQKRLRQLDLMKSDLEDYYNHLLKIASQHTVPKELAVDKIYKPQIISEGMSFRSIIEATAKQKSKYWIEFETHIPGIEGELLHNALLSIPFNQVYQHLKDDILGGDPIDMEWATSNNLWRLEFKTQKCEKQLGKPILAALREHKKYNPLDELVSISRSGWSGTHTFSYDLIQRAFNKKTNKPLPEFVLGASIWDAEDNENLIRTIRVLYWADFQELLHYKGPNEGVIGRFRESKFTNKHTGQRDYWIQIADLNTTDKLTDRQLEFRYEYYKQTGILLVKSF